MRMDSLLTNANSFILSISCDSKAFTYADSPLICVHPVCSHSRPYGMRIVIKKTLMLFPINIGAL